jgi:diacylglycerol kinase family enzyme
MDRWKKIEEQCLKNRDMQETPLPVCVHVTEKPDDARRFAQDITSARTPALVLDPSEARDMETVSGATADAFTAKTPHTIFVFGGDGTLNEVIDGIADLGNARLGYIPSGSGNDFARSMHIPADPEKVLRSLLGAAKALAHTGIRQTSEGESAAHIVAPPDGNASSGKAICGTGPNPVGIGNTSAALASLDVWCARFGDGRKRRFAISCGFGFDAEVCYEVQRSPLKKWLNKLNLGKLCYLLLSIPLIFRRRLIRFEVEISDSFVSCPASLFFAVMNQPYEGGGFRFCPEAAPDDGTLDAILVSDISRAGFFGLMPFALFGKHGFSRHVTFHRGRSYTIRCTPPCHCHTDGEPLGEVGYAEISLEDEKLQLILPG